MLKIGNGEMISENERINEQLRAELESCRKERDDLKKKIESYPWTVGEKERAELKSKAICAAIAKSWREKEAEDRAERAKQQLEECRRELAEVKDIARQTEDNAHNWRVAAEMKHPGVYDVERLYHHLHCDHCSKAEKTIAAQKSNIDFMLKVIEDVRRCTSDGIVVAKLSAIKEG